MHRGTTLIGTSLCLTLLRRRFLLCSKARLPGELVPFNRCGLHQTPPLCAGCCGLFPFLAFNHYIIAMLFMLPLHYLNILGVCQAFLYYFTRKT